MKNGEIMKNNLIQFYILLVVGLLSFMFFPNTFEVNILVIFLGLFVVLFHKEKLAFNEKQVIPLGIAMLIYFISIGLSNYTHEAGISLLRIIILMLAAFSAFLTV